MGFFRLKAASIRFQGAICSWSSSLVGPILPTGGYHDGLQSVLGARSVRSLSGTVSFRDAMAAIGWTSSKDFKDSIRYHDGFIEALDEVGCEEWGKGLRATCFRKRL